ncbi:MAG: response regulator transcription factor [Chloroflexi bacterium]|nr:response regulator transcription factor [Chloroflexota bacterium]
MPDTISFFLIEPEAPRRRDLRCALERAPWLVSAGEASGLDEALPQVQKRQPRVVLIAVAAPPDVEMEKAVQLRRCAPGSGVVAMVERQDEASALLALSIGAAACCARDLSPQWLTTVVRRVGEGERPIYQTVLQHPRLALHLLRRFQELLAQGPGPAVLVPSPLSPRQAEVLCLMAAGGGSKQVSGELMITEQTVKNHVAAILQKLSASNRTQAVAIALQNRWISLPAQREQPWTGIAHLENSGLFRSVI